MPPAFSVTLPDPGTWAAYPALLTDAARPIYLTEHAWGWPFDNVLKDDNGASFDTLRRILRLTLCGGHNGHGQNDTQEFDVSRMRWLSPVLDGSDPELTPIPKVATVPNNYTYADGKPGARHTAYGLRYLPHIDKVLACGGSAYGAAAWANSQATLWDPTTYVFELCASAPLGVGNGAANFFHPRTGEVVFINNTGRIQAFNPVTKVWRVISAFPSLDYLHALAYAPTVDKALLFGGGFAYEIDMSKTPPGVKDLKPTLPAFLTSTGKCGLDWSPDLEKLVCWNGGPELHLITPGTWDVETATLGGPNPGVLNGDFAGYTGARGVYGRMCVVPNTPGETGLTVCVVHSGTVAHLARVGGDTLPPPTEKTFRIVSSITPVTA